MTNEKSKVYIDILHYIRIYITENQLSYGDKIPSERELAEKLNVGRSSVREALRALELLGMIETRRGEGTFLKDFRDHNLIDLLGTFILEDSKAIDDVIEMNNMLEYNAIQLLLRSNHESELRALEKRLVHEGLTRYEFMKELVQLANNHLLYRIWIVLNEYVSLVHKHVNVEVDAVDKMKELVASLLERKQTEVLTSYQKLSLK
ncbi:FadR/GntR family transcriptional regulator [Metabacillus niabensis]|uniref:DNA-binding FadR family transcriptional regulator n=1 Tax=Metabacillus niabensis TaxID=324854 RepID=A0ABT9YYD7_9BACI|nr:GntR family transcriptional regulator [Metabacillus niabensis]MDQ0224616.1 DNA-binding FadR family transcriptional regulator [Metabacillus niabensis]